MVVVIAVIAAISALAIPAVSSAVNGPRLTQAAQALTNQLSLARQHATTKNRSVEVRFLRFRDPEAPAVESDPGEFGAVQLFEVLEAGVAVPMGKPEFFNQSIVLCADARSSLLDPEGTPAQTPRAPTASVDPEMPRGIGMDYRFVSFRFLPNGSTNLAVNHNWFVTVLAAKDRGESPKLPANFFILQVDPVSGTTRGFRPGMR